MDGGEDGAVLEDLFGEGFDEEEVAVAPPSGAGGQVEGGAPGGAGDDNVGVIGVSHKARHRGKVAETLHVPPVLEGRPAVGVTTAAHGRVSLVRLPKIITVATKPFDRATWNEEEEAAELADMGKGVAQDAMIRWRVAAGGGAATGAHDGLESNSRVVEWSDGSFTLHVGDEVFTLYSNRGRGGSGGSASDTTHLFQRAAAGVAVGGGGGSRKTEVVLQAEAVVADRLLVRALKTTVAEHSVFATRTGEVTATAGSGRAKRAKVEQVNLLVDPEAERAAREAEAAKEERAQAARKPAGRAAGGGQGVSAPAPATGFMGTSVKDLRKQLRAGVMPGGGGGDVGQKRRRPGGVSRLHKEGRGDAISLGEEDTDEEEEEEDDGEDMKGFVVDDEDGEDEASFEGEESTTTSTTGSGSSSEDDSDDDDDE